MLCPESQLDHARRVHGVAAFSPQFGGFKLYIYNYTTSIVSVCSDDQP